MKTNDTIINIGTNKKNFTGVRISKPFKDIIYSDVIDALKSSYQVPNGLIVQGWCDVTPNKRNQP